MNIGGKQMYLWRAVDGEGEVLDVLVQKRRNKRAALKLMRKLLRNQGVRPFKIVTDKLKSYGAALRDLRLGQDHCEVHARHPSRNAIAGLAQFSRLACP